MLPVPGGTVKLTVSPTTLAAPNVWAGSEGVVTAAAWLGSQAAGGFAGPAVPPRTMVGVPGGVQAGEAPDDRQAPATHDESEPNAAQSGVPAHDGKQNEPVEVLTHLPFAGHVDWSFGLHAAVQAPPGNSGLGSPAHSSPEAVLHPAPHAFPRSALAGLP
ncbi:MAG: hypothetical protein ACJ79H_12520 [Myxococcales bacterium]